MRIDRPCPMYLSSKNGPDSYYCKSCSKSVIDFRGKSTEEIEQSLTSETCGIFSANQLTDQPTMRWPQRILFTLLSIASFLGVSVSPLNAQTNSATNTQLETHKKVDAEKENTLLQIKKGKIKSTKRHRKTSRKGRTTMGCPAF